MKSPFVVFPVAAVIAALIVYGLFQLMNMLISAEFQEPEQSEQRVLEAITPQQETQEVRRTSRSRPQRLASADEPPPPPKLSASKADIDLPTPNIQGSAPTELDFGRVNSIAIDPVAISDRDAQPISPPVPQYPQRAAERGIEGSCEVRFDVNARGEPFNVEATCTDSVFRREAERAVSRVRFAPKIVRGQALERRNVVYPIEFGLDG